MRRIIVLEIVFEKKLLCIPTHPSLVTSALASAPKEILQTRNVNGTIYIIVIPWLQEILLICTPEARGPQAQGLRGLYQCLAIFPSQGNMHNKH